MKRILQPGEGEGREGAEDGRRGKVGDPMEDKSGGSNTGLKISRVGGDPNEEQARRSGVSEGEMGIGSGTLREGAEATSWSTDIVLCR